MKDKIYFAPIINEEFGYPLEILKEKMKAEDLNEVEAFIGTRELNSDYFFCNHYNETTLKGEGTCGGKCELYEPRNGKSGNCKFNGHLFSQGKKVIIRL